MAFSVGALSLVLTPFPPERVLCARVVLGGAFFFAALQARVDMENFTWGRQMTLAQTRLYKVHIAEKHRAQILTPLAGCPVISLIPSLSSLPLGCTLRQLDEHHRGHMPWV